MLKKVKLFSLQKLDSLDQINKVSNKFSSINFSKNLDQNGSFTDTAALIVNMNLIITADTAISHLAGALGVKVWTVLKKKPDWRWMLEREDTPWYPSMRLFRQNETRDWSGVFPKLDRS